MVCCMTSCKSTQNTVSYFQDIDQSAIYTNPKQGNHEQVIVPGNDLIIRVSNIDLTAVAAFNLPAATFQESADINLQSSPLLQTYRVDKDGYIKFPVLGKIYVRNKLPRLVAQELEQKIGDYAPNSQVQVLIDGYHISVLGEVNAPGYYQLNKDRTTLAELIAMCGDLTLYGQRDNILVIRETEEGTKYFRIDLTKAETLSQPEFYLQQNDVVYVEPIRVRRKMAKYDTMKQYNLSLTSTIVSLVSVIASLGIALLIK